MLEIVERLEQAASKFDQAAQNQDRFAQMLKAGQKREYDNYAWKIEGLRESIASSKKRSRILRLEEKRFLAQADLMNRESSDPSDQIVGVEGAQLLASILTTTNSDTEPSSKCTIRYGYIESKILDTIGQDAELVFSQSPGYPIGAFAEDDELLNPVRLTSYARSLNFARSRPVRFNGPNYSGLIDRNGKLRNSFQNPNTGIAAPSLFNSPYATRNYRQNQVVTYRFYQRAYPFGILRSDLRRFLNSSQPPWLFPGSPNNLRYNQLRTDYGPAPFGRSGVNTLKSKNYRDLSGPGYFN